MRGQFPHMWLAYTRFGPLLNCRRVKVNRAKKKIQYCNSWSPRFVLFLNKARLCRPENELKRWFFPPLLKENHPRNSYSHYNDGLQTNSSAASSFTVDCYSVTFLIVLECTKPPHHIWSKADRITVDIVVKYEQYKQQFPESGTTRMVWASFP